MNYYNAINLLKLDYSASLAEIKTAYRLLAKKYHPDSYISPNSVKFKEITAAYNYLMQNPIPNIHQQPAYSYTVSKNSTKYAKWEHIFMSISLLVIILVSLKFVLNVLNINILAYSQFVFLLKNQLGLITLL